MKVGEGCNLGDVNRRDGIAFWWKILIKRPLELGQLEWDERGGVLKQKFVKRIGPKSDAT